MEVEEGRRLARQVVGDEMVRQSLGPYELARKANVDPNTVGDFVAGRRWPQAGTRNKIASALGWRPETIDQLARGEVAPALLADLDEDASASKGSNRGTVGPQDQDAGVLLSLPPGVLDDLAPAEREEAIAAAKATLLERIREIRRRVGP